MGCRVLCINSLGVHDDQWMWRVTMIRAQIFEFETHANEMSKMNNAYSVIGPCTRTVSFPCFTPSRFPASTIPKGKLPEEDGDNDDVTAFPKLQTEGGSNIFESLSVAIL